MGETWFFEDLNAGASKRIRLFPIVISARQKTALLYGDRKRYKNWALLFADMKQSDRPDAQNYMTFNKLSRAYLSSHLTPFSEVIEEENAHTEYWATQSFGRWYWWL